jgi:hypothetical protein
MLAQKYKDLDWDVVSGKMAWFTDTVYALHTGLRSWITVLEITDPSLSPLTAMCEAATTIQQVTNSGRHYVFRYCPRLKTRAAPLLGLNIFNDETKVFCEPTPIIGVHSDGRTQFLWLRLPEDKSDIPEMPSAIIDYLWTAVYTSKTEYLVHPERYAWNSLLYTVQFTQAELLEVADWITMPELIRYQKSVTLDFLERHFAKAIDDCLEVDWRLVELHVRT